MRPIEVIASIVKHIWPEVSLRHFSQFTARHDEPSRNVTTCLENLEMCGNLTAVGEISGNWPKVRDMSGKNLVGENHLLLTLHLGLYQILVVSCMYGSYAGKYNVTNGKLVKVPQRVWKMSGNISVDGVWSSCYIG